MLPDTSSVASILAWYRTAPWQTSYEITYPSGMLGEAYRLANGAGRKNLTAAALSIFENGDAETRTEMLTYLTSYGDDAFPVLRTWLEHPPPWVDDPASGKEHHARLARELLRWGLNLARRDPSVRPWLAALYSRDPIPFEWLAFWVGEDPAGEGLKRIHEALDRGDDLTRNAHGIGVVYGSLAPACLPALFDAFRGRGTKEVRKAILSEISARQSANPTIVAEARAALG
jgi:hypothetical protein